MASSANNHNPFCSFQRHAKLANLSEWMAFCAAKAISQLLLFFLLGLRSIQKLIWGINEPGQKKQQKKLLICDFWKIRCIILNLSPQITQWICIFDALVLYVSCCCQWESLLRVLFGLHFGCAAPLMSACMFVFLSLSRCVFSLPQLRTVSSIPAHFAQSRLSVRHQPLSGLLLPHTVCGCSILTCICSFVLLQLKVSPVFRHPLHLFPLLSVKHVLSCCCNVSPLSVFQDAPLFLWYTNPSQAPLCVSAWDLSVCCLFASVFSTR